MPDTELSPKQIRELLANHFSLEAADLHDNTVLFSSGLLDSFHLVEMIPVLEKASGRRIKPGDINLENLDTPQRISDFLSKPTP